MKRVSYLTAMLCSAFFALSGCGGSGYSGGTPQNADVSGPWQATAASTSFPGTTPVIVEANLTDYNGSITSSAFVAVNSCVASDANSKVSGSVNVNAVTLTATYAGVSVSLSGTVSGNRSAGLTPPVAHAEPIVAHGRRRKCHRSTATTRATCIANRIPRRQFP